MVNIHLVWEEKNIAADFQFLNFMVFFNFKLAELQLRCAKLEPPIEFRNDIFIEYVHCIDFTFNDSVLSIRTPEYITLNLKQNTKITIITPGTI